MKISKLKGSNKNKGLCRVRIEGEMTIYKAAEIMDKFIPFWREYNQFELDLAGVGEIDTAGVQLLLMFARKSEASKNAMPLLATSEPVSEVLNIYRLSPRFNIQTQPLQ